MTTIRREQWRDGVLVSVTEEPAPEEPPPLPDAVAPLDDLANAQSLEEVRTAAAALREALIARGII